MLFQQLYNWIKYKTLPPSILYKNRLFIERDSKNRKIFNNFGLLFRSSKWSNYETYNIKLKFRTSIYRFLMLFFFLFFLILFITKFKKYYICFWLFNAVSFLGWNVLDTFDYYFIFLIWAVTAFMASTVNLVFFFFFFNNFDTDKNHKFSNNRKIFEAKKILMQKTPNISVPSQSDLSWLLYSWFTYNSKFPNLLNFDKMFDRFFKINKWEDTSSFFTTLYKLLYLVNLSSAENNIFVINLHFNKLTQSNPISFLNTKHVSVVFYHYLTQNSKTLDERVDKDPSFTYKRCEWNPFFFNIELQNLSHLLKYKNGLFFMKTFSFEHFLYDLNSNPEMLFLSFNLRNQLNSAKWNRWLYKYSLLHRKSFKNSHKLTLVKKLANSGFYNSTLFDKNLWISENFIKFQNFTNFFSASYNIYYNKFSKLETPFYVHSFNEPLSVINKKKLKILSFYENSFFWYLKRNYFLNSLSSNFVKSSTCLYNFDQPVLRNHTDVQKSNTVSRIKYFFFLSNILNSLNFNTHNFCQTSFTAETLSNIKRFSIRSYNENYNLKDVALEWGDENFLSQENLEKLFWISAGLPSFFNKILFFSYFSNHSNETEVNFSFFKNSPSYLDTVKPWSVFSSLNFDNFFINDLIYWTLFK